MAIHSNDHAARILQSTNAKKAAQQLEKENRKKSNRNNLKQAFYKRKAAPKNTIQRRASIYTTGATPMQMCATIYTIGAATMQMCTSIVTIGAAAMQMCATICTIGVAAMQMCASTYTIGAAAMQMCASTYTTTVPGKTGQTGEHPALPHPLARATPGSAHRCSTPCVAQSRAVAALCVAESHAVAFTVCHAIKCSHTASQSRVVTQLAVAQLRAHLNARDIQFSSCCPPLLMLCTSTS
eukprot:scaffold43886_cov20-Tisochrysis_lutea.AAC.2